MIYLDIGMPLTLKNHLASAEDRKVSRLRFEPGTLQPKVKHSVSRYNSWLVLKGSTNEYTKDFQSPFSLYFAPNYQPSVIP